MADRHGIGWSDEAEIAFRRHLDYLVFGHQEAINHRHPVLLMDEGDDMLWSRQINPYSKHAYEFFKNVRDRVFWAESKLRFAMRSQSVSRYWEYHPSEEQLSEMIWAGDIRLRMLTHKIESKGPRAAYLVESIRLEQSSDLPSDWLVYCEIYGNSKNPKALRSPRLVIAAASRESADSIMTFATLAAQ